MARLTAIADGRDHPAGRKVGPIDAATGAMFGDALRKSGAPYTTLAFFAGTRKLEDMATGMRCDTGWHSIRALRGMPIAQGYPLYAQLYGL